MSRQSNAEKKDLNYQAYCYWVDGKSLEDMVKYLQRRKNKDTGVIEHKLGRNKINKDGLNIGTAITQNPHVRRDLQDLDDKLLEAGLREEDVLPPSDDTEGEPDPSTAQPSFQGGLSDDERRRLNELVEENAYLKEELKEKNARMKKYGLVDKILTDTMRWPR